MRSFSKPRSPRHRASNTVVTPAAAHCASCATMAERDGQRALLRGCTWRSRLSVWRSTTPGIRVSPSRSCAPGRLVAPGWISTMVPAVDDDGPEHRTVTQHEASVGQAEHRDPGWRGRSQHTLACARYPHPCARVDGARAGWLWEGIGARGSRSRTRTYDRAINSRLLYQLSYSGSLRGGVYSRVALRMQRPSEQVSDIRSGRRRTARLRGGAAGHALDLLAHQPLDHRRQDGRRATASAAGAAPRAPGPRWSGRRDAPGCCAPWRGCAARRRRRTPPPPHSRARAGRAVAVGGGAAAPADRRGLRHGYRRGRTVPACQQARARATGEARGVGVRRRGGGRAG